MTDGTDFVVYMTFKRQMLDVCECSLHRFLWTMSEDDSMRDRPVWYVRRDGYDSTSFDYLSSAWLCQLLQGSVDLGGKGTVWYRKVSSIHLGRKLTTGGLRRQVGRHGRLSRWLENQRTLGGDY